jgi:hypothetical protein
MRAGRACWRRRRDRDQHDDRSKDQPHQGAPERAAPHEPEQESSPAQAGRCRRASSPRETESADPAAESRPEAGTDLPPIEAPRSWTKEDKDLFTSLPRATQERIAERERSREGDFNRRQQEAAEKSKALEAERSKAEQARQQYEAALPQLLQTLEQQQAGEFADIKTLADVERPAKTGPATLYGTCSKELPRSGNISRWHSSGKPGARAAVLGIRPARGRSLQGKVLLAADAKRPQACRPRRSRAQGTGLPGNRTGAIVARPEDLSLRDHRVQLLIRDATLWRDAQAKAKAAATRPVPPVQRPGVSQPKGAAQDAQIQHLTQKLEKTGNLKDAAALLRARRAGTR